jgi:hypothetical protein
VQATAVTARLLDLRRNPATGNRLGLALVLRFRLATVDPVDKPRTFLPLSLMKSGSGGRKDSSALFQVRSKRVSGVSVIPRMGQISFLSAGEIGPDSLTKNRPRSSDSADLRTIQSC